MKTAEEWVKEFGSAGALFGADRIRQIQAGTMWDAAAVAVLQDDGNADPADAIRLKLVAKAKKLDEKSL